MMLFYILCTREHVKMNSFTTLTKYGKYPEGRDCGSYLINMAGLNSDK
jgi:hypothetical protein